MTLFQFIILKYRLYQINRWKKHNLRFNTRMKLLNNFGQHMIFLLTPVFTVEASETKKKLKNDTKFTTKFTNLFELKAIFNY